MLSEYSPIARIRHFEESLDLTIIWIDVLPNGSIFSFQKPVTLQMVHPLYSLWLMHSI